MIAAFDATYAGPPLPAEPPNVPATTEVDDVGTIAPDFWSSMCLVAACAMRKDPVVLTASVRLNSSAVRSDQVVEECLAAQWMTASILANRAIALSAATLHCSARDTSAATSS